MMLFHYTCDHAVKIIGKYGVLQPNKHGLPDLPPLIWLTDMEEPDRERLGLTSHTLSCDRMKFRYIVETELAVPWLRWAEEHQIASFMREYVLQESRKAPEHWFVSTEPLSAKRDDRFCALSPDTRTVSPDGLRLGRGK